MFQRVNCRSVSPSQTLVVDKQECAHYWAALLELWKVKTNHFPGAHPTSVDTNTITAFARHPYVVSLKTDGVRFILFLTRRPDGLPIALMINRSEDMYEVSAWASEAFFDGTILDGELVWERSGTCMHYLVFDVVSLSGSHVADRVFGERLQLIHSTLLGPVHPDAADTDVQQQVRDEQKIVLRHVQPTRIVMLPKSCATLNNTLKTWMSRNASPYRNDGLLFTRTDVAMPFGRTAHMLKWKELHTIDVTLAIANETINCQVMGRNGQLISLEHSIDFVTHVVLETNELTTEAEIVECAITRWSRATGHLHLYPVRSRRDKNHPNAPATVISTLRNIEEALTIADIMNSVHYESPAPSSKKNGSPSKPGTHARQPVVKRPRRPLRSATSVNDASA